MVIFPGRLFRLAAVDGATLCNIVGSVESYIRAAYIITHADDCDPSHSIHNNRETRVSLYYYCGRETVGKNNLRVQTWHPPRIGSTFGKANENGSNDREVRTSVYNTFFNNIPTRETYRDSDV